MKLTCSPGLGRCMREDQKFELYVHVCTYVYVHICMCVCVYISRFSVTKSWACSSVPEHEFDPNTKTTESFNGLALFVVEWVEAALGHKKGPRKEVALAVRTLEARSRNCPARPPDGITHASRLACTKSQLCHSPAPLPSCIVPLPQAHTYVFFLCVSSLSVSLTLQPWSPDQ